jgi:transposase
MLPNVKQKTIKPIITTVVVKGTMIYTDEYSIYARLPVWGYQHKTVCHSRGEYARDEDGDGFHEVHVNTMEGFWSLLRSWLRPHRGISQEKLPIYLGFFQFVHNTRRRGKALLGALVVHPANRLRLSCSRAVEGSCQSAWEPGHDASVAGPDG